MKRLGKRERALARSVKAHNESVMRSNMNAPMPERASMRVVSKSGEVVYRGGSSIASDRLLAKAHTPGCYAPGMRTKETPKRPTCARWSEK